jgi:hypothetical protein
MPCSGFPDEEGTVASRKNTRWGWPRLTLTLTWVCMMGPAGWAHAQPRHRAGIDVAVGGDTNPSLAANPRDRARMDDTALAPSATLAVDVWTRLTAYEREPFRLRLSPHLGARGFSSGGAYLDLGLNAAARYEQGRLALDLAGTFGGYAATFALDNAIYGDLSLGARVRIEAFHLGAESYARFRSYMEDQLDGIYGARALVGADHGRFRWEAQIGADQRRSSDPRAARAELYVALEASGIEGAWEWLAGTTVYARWFESAPRDGREWILRGRLDRTITPRFALFLAVQAGRARPVRNGDESLVYRRGAIEVGVSVRLHPTARPTDNESAERVERGRYRFVLHAPDAQEVILLAEFLDWDESRGALTPTRDGRFEGTFDVPPGRHRYRMLVDGVPVTPPARAYADDGFGGRDAVLTVE